MRMICYATVFALVGCGAPPPDPVPEGTEALAQVKALLTEYAKAKGKPPAGLADIKDYETSYMGAYKAIQTTKCNLFWNTPFTVDGKLIVAFCPPLPGSPGPVLLQDGTIREMTAAEFKKDPRAHVGVPG